ncbi:triose-phosphate isomerase [Deinococcota bacterium DY0809b]
MRTPLLAGNWKMHKTPSEARVWFAEFLETNPALQSSGQAAVEVALLPSFPLLPVAAEQLAGSGVVWGAQDVSAHGFGAYTGEVAAEQLADLGCRYVVVGHSERRAYWNESDALVAAKAHRAMEAGLVPILCVGERLEEREAGRAVSFTLEQLAGSLEGVALETGAELVIAYEPVWAIGTGKTASADDAQTMAAAIRSFLAQRYGAAVAERTRILYGGSMKPANTAEILAGPDVDGGLVGGASLEVASFSAMVEAAS